MTIPIPRDGPTRPAGRPGPKPWGPLMITVTPAQRAALEARADGERVSISTIVRRFVTAGLAADGPLSRFILAALVIITSAPRPLKGAAIVSSKGISTMQQRQEPIEGTTDCQATPPTRTGDDVPTSVITPQGGGDDGNRPLPLHRLPVGRVTGTGNNRLSEGSSTVASSIEQSSNLHPDRTGPASAREKKQTTGMPPSEGARKRAARRGANVHLQDEDQAPTGKNAGDKQAAETEVAESRGHTRGKARTVAG